MDLMKYVMSIEVNDNIYKLYEADIINDEKDTMGITVFIDNTICIKRVKRFSQMLRTLKHELTHVWLYEYGHNQHDEDKTFNFEDICEIVACSNNWINKIVNEYIKIKEQNITIKNIENS